ncbi:MAG: 1-acyl-sn-glycerol-3-phosphate acyltransferase [Euzebyaceae bacterium]|nr:1-acyl-sn-glycerol-3-phosphate acyltransferase [Euzebyaceae bacterium]
MEYVYRPVIGAIIVLFRSMGWRLSIEGAEHIPTSGAAVIATNHVGYLDFTFVGYGARPRGRLVRFLAKKEIFDHPVAGPLMRGMKHIPVDRFGRVQDALAAGVDALRRGELVGMFPEGTISRSFVPARGKSGAARMAMTAGVPLIPGAVWASQRLLTKGRPPNLQRGVAITVAYGEPVAYEPGEDPGVVTDRLMAAVGELVQHCARTYPQQPAGDSDRWWLPAHLGGTAPSVDEAKEMAGREAAERRARRRSQAG